MAEHAFIVGRTVLGEFATNYGIPESKTLVYAPADADVQVYYTFIMPDGSEFGVRMKGDMTWDIGAWNEKGEWIDLVLCLPKRIAPIEFDLKTHGIKA